MANDFLTAQQGPIASVGLEILRRQIVLPALVWRDVSTDLNRKQGDTVTIPRPATLTGRRYDRTPTGTPAVMPPIVLDELAETGIPITIDTHHYSAVAIEDEDDALNLRDFARQILAPQMIAVAEDLENSVAAAFASLPATNDITVAAADTDPVLRIIEAHTYLSENKVPNRGRVLLMGPAFAGRMLADDRFSRADSAGDTTALRTAAFTPKYGFQPYESLAIPTNEAYAFTREAVAMATVTPRNPRGATASATVNESGVVMRWLSDYDAAYLRDRSIVSILAGSKLIDEDRIVRLKLGA